MKVQPDLSRYQPEDIGSAMMEAIERIGTPIIPHEVFNMYKKQWETTVRDGRRREEINKTGRKGSPADFVTKKQSLELCINLVEMLPTSNVRLLREVVGVVRIVCLLWRPWEIGTFFQKSLYVINVPVVPSEGFLFE